MPFDSLTALLTFHAGVRPDSVALRCGPESLTYAELASRARRVGDALTAAGVGGGGRVGYYGRTSVAFFETLFGAATIGAVVVPLNWRLAPPEVAAVLADSEVELLVVDPEFAGTVDAVRADLPALRTVVCRGEHPDLPLYGTWRDGRPPDASPPGGHGPEDIALQIYTSGTTGRPKGVMSRTSGLTTYLDSLGDVARFSASSVSICTLPLFHIGGIGWVLAGLNRGATTVMLRETGGDDIVRAADQTRATVLIAVPSVIRTILDSPALPHADLGSLRTLYYGGGPVTHQVLDEALATLKCELVQGFGLTECPLVTALPPEDHAVELLASCGRAVPGTDVRVVDPVTGTDAPTGSVGELWVRSPQTMAGYWRQPEATAEAIAEGAWLRTGDAARMNDAGYVFMADRLKDMIVTGGENVYPAEVENVLARHPAVGACAVIGVPSRRWTEAVVAVVVLRDGHEATADDLLSHCRGLLAGYKRPKSVAFVDELPRTPAGKVLKYRLKADYEGSVD